jgi:hypothetical protein
MRKRRKGTFEEKKRGNRVRRYLHINRNKSESGRKGRIGEKVSKSEKTNDVPPSGISTVRVAKTVFMVSIQCVDTRRAAGFLAS